MDNKFELDLTLLSKELKLLLELLKEENEENIQRNKKELFHNIDWNHFLHIARYHRVYPLMYVRLKNMEERIVPKSVIETLYQEYKRNTFQMLQLSAEMERVGRLFAENDIPLLFLKGPAIAYDIYGDISLRTSKDLDVLIEEMNIDKAEEILFSLGYEKKEVPTVLNEKKWRYLHIEYYHPKMGTQIEVHWRMQPFPMIDASFHELWKRKRESTLIDYPVYFLGEEDLYVYLVRHGARHGWFRLRWLKDIDQMIRNGIDFEKIDVLFKKYKCCFVSGQVFLLTSQLLHTPITQEMEQNIKGRQVGNLSNEAYFYIRNEKSRTVSYTFLMKNNIQKVISVIYLCYPTYADTQVINLPKQLHFLYFPLRPFLWTWRKTKQLISS